MRVVEPKIDVVFHLPEGTTRVETFLEQVGRVCYKSEDRITQDSADKFIGKLHDLGHHAMLEHAVATARLVCDRGVSHELVRHRISSYAQESTRYCDYTKEKHGAEIAVIKPQGLQGDGGPMVKFEGDDFLPVRRSELEVILAHLCRNHTSVAVQGIERLMDTAMTEEGLWAQSMHWADQSYRTMRQLGSPPQRARHVLPIGVKTEIVITTNLREWMHIFSLRCTNKAHPHIRSLFLQALRVFAKRVPAMFAKLHTELTGETVEVIADLG